MRMDVINRTSSESFQFHQLSSVGNEWEISLLQPMDTVFPSDFLVAGQALSCFFKLKVGDKLNVRPYAVTGTNRFHFIELCFFVFSFNSSKGFLISS